MKTFQEYAAVARWVDADTFHGVIDQGIGIFRAGGMKVVNGRVVLDTVRCRCAIIQAPEINTPEGVQALNFASQLVPPGVYPCLTYKGDDAFDRPLVDLILPDGSLFSQVMLEWGHAVVPYKIPSPK